MPDYRKRELAFQVDGSLANDNPNSTRCKPKPGDTTGRAISKNSSASRGLPTHAPSAAESQGK
jgi:hypothetical protein